MKIILLYLWQLPQNIVGVIMSLINPVYVEHYDGEKVTFSSAMPSGISLGKYIIVYNGLHRYDWQNENTFKHEYGHARQSRMLGWFYLLVIGLPSLIWAAIHPLFEDKVDYYSFYTEKWADKLGNVKR